MANLLQANRHARMKTAFGGPDAYVLKHFTAIERLSEPFTIVAEVIDVSGETAAYHIGEKVSIEVDAGPARSRHFHGRLWDVTELWSDADGMHCRFTIKPWASFLDINIESRIYQAKKVDDIVKDITDRRSGIGPKLKFDVGSYPALEYCVQWQESDFDFISRQFERHGIYYYFSHSASEHEMIACDDKLHHTMAPGLETAIPLLAMEQGKGRRGGGVWNLTRRYEVAPNKATVTDFDFETPTQKLKADRTVDKYTSMDGYQLAELYVHPGGFTKATGQGRGTQISKGLAEAARAPSIIFSVDGDAFAATVGYKIGIEIDKRAGTSQFLIAATTHVYTANTYRSGSTEEDELSVRMELIPHDIQYRPAMKTPRPRIYGPQTAIVTGADGQEIDTDKYGRIKVHFHWDRVQEGGSTSSCWIRVAQSMAGSKWGGFVLPRIGQEVVVEFLNGDPDAPLVTGAVYNGQNEVPYPLPANKTRTTFKSKSSPKSQGFNELRFEDKAGSEEVFFHAEKDLNSIIDKGSETRTLNSGNRTTTISSGDETLKISKGKRTETIHGDETLTIEQGNRSDTLKMGNDELAIKMGNRTTTLDMGNDQLTLKMGNRTIKLNLGKHSTDAMQGIELKCGMSTIKMTPMSIEIKSMMIKIEADIQLQTKGLMVQQEASALHIIKGGIVMIN